MHAPAAALGRWDMHRDLAPSEGCHATQSMPAPYCGSKLLDDGRSFVLQIPIVCCSLPPSVPAGMHVL
jgi:hypothetical protein